ncbi:MAG: mechanosensitive ion channel family protein [Hyphomicrobiales bacterium]
MQNIVEQMGGYAPLAMSALQALVFLILGYLVAGIVQRYIRRRATKSDTLDETLGNFFTSIAKWVILAVVVIAVLQLFGFQATSLVAILGAASLAIGLALQGTLSNVAAGVMLIIFRPYKIGDYVDVGGTSGTVKEITLFTTELATPDNVQIIVPNGQAWGSVIQNYSTHEQRRVDVTFGIDYGDDADKAIAIILECAKQDARVLDDPEPFAKVVNLGDSSVDIAMRIWCENADYWDLKFAMTRNVKLAFDDQGISIPYPHQVEISKPA